VSCHETNKPHNFRLILFQAKYNKMLLVVKEGDSVILKSNDGSSYFGEASLGGSCRIRELSFPSNLLIGVEYGSVWEIIHGKGGGIKKAEDGELVPVGAFSDTIRGGLVGGIGSGEGISIGGQQGVQGEGGREEEVEDEELFDNRFLVDSNKSQSVSTAEIASMKAKGKTGEEIVRALVENSTTFSTKTAFSQQKYITKKTSKYIRRFRVMSSTAVSISELAYELFPEKVLGLRSDSLGAILNAANIEPGKKVMVFDGTSGLLTGAVMERMIDYRNVSTSEENIITTATTTPSSEPKTAMSKSNGVIFLPYEDKRLLPNLSIGSKFNLPPGPTTQQMLVGLKYSELVEWVDPIAQLTFSRQTKKGNTAIISQQSQPVSQPRIAGQKRSRDEIKSDSSQNEDLMKVFIEKTKPSAISSSIQAPVSGGVQFFRAPLKSKKEKKPKQAKNSNSNPTTSDASKLTRATRQLKLWSYSTEERKDCLSYGVDSVIIAVQYDPIELVLSSIRYCKPSSSLVVFSKDVIALGRIYSTLKKADCAVNILLEEKFTRELQVLSGRTHPLMMMNAASGFMLSATIIPSRYSALFYPLLSTSLTSTTPSTNDSIDVLRMKEAIVLSKLCVSVETAYNVGAILVSSSGDVLSTGFSREFEGNTHAEEVCLMKLQKKDENGQSMLQFDVCKGATLYSTMEPCSKRLSGKKPCCELLIGSGITRVVIAVKEPTTFVQQCEGAKRLASTGIKVDFLNNVECQSLALAANSHLKLAVEAEGVNN
jgi:pyrimidine deaminase RibD-like protein